MENTKEIWRPVKGFDFAYEISSIGRARSIPRVVNCGTGLYGKPYYKMLKIKISRRGYENVGLTKNDVKTSKMIHKLVAESFLNHTPCGMKEVVDHIDNNPLNNNVENLQIITQRENCSKKKKGLSSKYVGVCWDTYNGRWKSSIQINGKVKNLGGFKTELEAHNAYQNKLREINKKSKFELLKAAVRGYAVNEEAIINEYERLLNYQTKK